MIRAALAWIAMVLVLASVLLAPPAGAAAADGVALRIGEHPGFARLVFDLPPGMVVRTVAEGGRVLLVFPETAALDRAALLRAGLPRNVASLAVEGAGITLVLAPGARPRPARLGNRLVVDVLDPPGPAPAPAKSLAAGPKAPLPATGPRAPTAALGGSERKAPEPTQAARIPVDATPLPTPLQTDPPGSAPPGSTPPASPPASPPPSAAAPSPPPPPPGFVVPADLAVGAAALRRGELGLVVIDRRLSPNEAATTGRPVQAGPVSTLIQVPLAPEQALALTRVATGWSVQVAPAQAPAAMPVQPGSGGLVFPMARPGRTVVVIDPATGGSLLVGTSLDTGPELGVGAARLTPDGAILSTWLGVAVAPSTDQLDLRATPAGFVLQGGLTSPRALLTSEGRRFDVPDDTPPALANRLRAQLATAAAGAARARSPARLAAAQTMLALGMAVEAQALLQTIAADDPAAAADAQVGTLSAVAAVLADRLDEAAALDRPQQPATPELTLWQALRDRRLGRATEATARLPELAALAWSYPELLRARIWPDIAEAIAEAGRPLPDDRATPFAKALALERSGQLEPALAAWQALAATPDRRNAVRAAVRAIDLGLAAGRMTPAEAAERAERLTVAWRGDARELSLRLRAAELRAASGGWRPALDLLRETEPLFPDDGKTIQARKTAVFEAMLASEGGGLSPFEVVLLAADYADCVPDGPSGARLATLLADKLLALDLPARAIPVLQGLVARSPAGPARARFGNRLARLLLDGGDAIGARSAFDASASADAPAPLQSDRALTRARLRAAEGDLAGATADLLALGTAEADDLRAGLLANAGDWRGSLAALSDLVARTVPPDGPLPDAAQAVVLRQATAAVRVVDTALLQRLARLVPRMTGPRADLLQALTEAPVTSTRELPRSARELKLARTISAQIQAVVPDR